MEVPKEIKAIFEGRDRDLAVQAYQEFASKAPRLENKTKQHKLKQTTEETSNFLY